MAGAIPYAGGGRGARNGCSSNRIVPLAGRDRKLGDEGRVLKGQGFMGRVGQRAGWRVFAVVCLGFGASCLWAQSNPPAKPPAQEDNPFPGQQADPQQGKPEQNKTGQGKQDPSKQDPSKQDQNKQSGDNPFPGEDANAPIIPVDPDPGRGPVERRPGAAGSGRDSGASQSDVDGLKSDGGDDPVKSPDLPGSSDDGFSSSRSGISRMPAEEDAASPNKAKK